MTLKMTCFDIPAQSEAVNRLCFSSLKELTVRSYLFECV